MRSSVLEPSVGQVNFGLTAAEGARVAVDKAQMSQNMQEFISANSGGTLLRFLVLTLTYSELIHKLVH